MLFKEIVAKSNDYVFTKRVVKTLTTIRPILCPVSFTFIEFAIISMAKFVLPILILNQWEVITVVIISIPAELINVELSSFIKLILRVQKDLVWRPMALERWPAPHTCMACAKQKPDYT